MKNKVLYKLMLGITTLISLIYCGEDRTYEYLEMTAENQWTYSRMKEVYLWGDDIRQPERSIFFSTPSKFFSALLSKQDNSSFFTDSASSASYGMKFTIMRDPLGEKRNQYYALVLFAEPGSPAALAGISRGTWVSAIDGKALTSSSGSMLQSGKATNFVTHTIEYNDEEERYYWSKADTLSMTQAAPLKNNAIYLDSTYSMRSSKAGYIVCNSLDGENTAEQFSNILLTFTSKDVTDIILDMRYCANGDIEIAAEIASMLVPASLVGSPFATLVNKDSAETVSRYTEQCVNVSDKKLYIITGNSTKGIAELFIASVNASRGMHEVVTVGSRTAGANVMTEAIESPYGFTINPAVALIRTSGNNWLSSEGISPDYPINEIEEPENIYPLGNKQEFILRNIEHLIINGSLPGK